MKILCQKCQAKPAVFYYEQSINGKKSDCALCAECAAEWKQSQKTEQEAAAQSPLSGIDTLFGSLFGVSAAPSRTNKRCPLCNSSYADLRRTGKVGCAVCYETFDTELRPTLRSIHGTQTHTGRAPHGISGKNEKKRKLEKLRASLEKAIASEEFEEAARLRDDIRELERNM